MAQMETNAGPPGNNNNYISTIIPHVPQVVLHKAKRKLLIYITKFLLFLCFTVTTVYRCFFLVCFLRLLHTALSVFLSYACVCLMC